MLVQIVEHCASVPSLIMGETQQQIATDMDTESFREPLGVCAGITPFNFPAMIPLWMFPLAATCGNTYVLRDGNGYVSVLSAWFLRVQLRAEAFRAGPWMLHAPGRARH